MSSLPFLLFPVLKYMKLLNIFLKGTVKLVFQPGEEGYGGAYHMLQDTVLDDIRSIFMLHVSPSIPTGSIGSRPGPLFAVSGGFVAIIRGKGGHAAAPHKSNDPVLAASFAILALQQIVSREMDPLEAGVSFSFLLSRLLQYTY